jgi:hypothetical protein
LLGYVTNLTTKEVFSMWSMPCSVLGNRTLNMSTITEGVFYLWSVQKVYDGKRRSFASSHSWESVGQGHEVVMEKSWEYKDENGACP